MIADAITKTKTLTIMLLLNSLSLYRLFYQNMYIFLSRYCELDIRILYN